MSEFVKEQCTVLANEFLSDEYYRMVFRSPEMAKRAKAGQFVHVLCDDLVSDPLLRRPISINDIDGDDIAMICKIVGKGTEVLGQKKAGDTVDVLGPLGHPFEWQKHTGKVHVLVGGGVGIPPMSILCKELQAAGETVAVALGGRSEIDILDYALFQSLTDRVFVATEDGSLGDKGFVTIPLERELKALDKNFVLYACGPDVMLRSVGQLASDLGASDVQVSFENRMGCAVGVCLGCIVETKYGRQRVCKEGPVLPWKDISWDEMFEHQGARRAVPCSLPDGESLDLGVQIGSVRMKNPVVTASGTFGYATEYKDLIDVNLLGGVTTKGVSLTEWKGNANYRLVETPSGLINSIGLQNLGVDDFVANKLPKLREMDTAVIVNISEHSEEGYAQLAERLTREGGVDIFELNISCPNVGKDGLEFAKCPKSASRIVRLVKDVTDTPVIVKMSPNVTSVVEIALACEQAGADGLSVINTLLAMAIDIKTRRPLLGNVKGGLSGPAIRPIAVRMVWEIYASSCQLPMIGMGGIVSWQDAVEFILAGASAVACGTGTFINPHLSLEVIAGIEQYMKDQGFAKLSDMVGAAHRS